MHNSITHVTALGVNGFYPSHNRHTMCFLAQTRAGDAILFDAGTGLSRLNEPAIRTALQDVPSLNIVLSHYHLDHVAGLPYLVDLWDRPVTLLAPAPPLVDASPDDALLRLTGPPLFPVALTEFHHPVTMIPYCGDFELAGITIRTRRQQHPGGSVALRFTAHDEDRQDVSYVTDTTADPETAVFAHGSGLLLHEIWVSEQQALEDPRLVRGHSADRAVIELAIRAEVQTLWPVHHHPGRSTDDLRRSHRSLIELRDQTYGRTGSQARMHLSAAIDGETVRLTR